MQTSSSALYINSAAERQLTHQSQLSESDRFLNVGEVPDQAEWYASSLLLRAKLTEKEKYNLLRATSVTIAGIRAYGKARSSKGELASILSFYLERIVLDLKYHEKGIAANLSYVKKRCYGVVGENVEGANPVCSRFVATFGPYKHATCSFVIVVMTTTTNSKFVKVCNNICSRFVEHH